MDAGGGRLRFFILFLGCYGLGPKAKHGRLPPPHHNFLAGYLSLQKLQSFMSFQWMVTWSAGSFR
jgi:hypothetical protein